MPYRKTGERLTSRSATSKRPTSWTRRLATPLKISISRLKLGSLARDRGEYREAIDWHQQALQVFIDERNYRELVTYIELARDTPLLKAS